MKRFLPLIIFSLLFCAYSPVQKEYINKHKELIDLNDYLKQMEEMDAELKRKYDELNKKGFRPDSEASSLSGLKSFGMALSGDENGFEEEFQKLPWGGWSRNWSKKLGDLRRKTQSIATTCSEAEEAKKQISVALHYLVILHNDYEDLLDKKNPQMNFRRNSFNEAILKSKKMLSLDSILTKQQSPNQGSQKFQMLVNIDKNTINDFKINDAINSQRLFELINEKSDEINETNFVINSLITLLEHRYYNKGFSITLSKDAKTQKNRIVKISMYFKGFNFEDEHYEPFKGEIASVSLNDKTETIKQKFGNDYESLGSADSPQWRFKRGKNYICFIFDSINNIDSVIIFSNREDI